MVRATSDTPYDVIIADIRLPDMNGYELMLKLQEIVNPRAAGLMTGFGYDPEHSIVNARKAGLPAWAILYKPFRLDQLLSAVEHDHPRARTRCRRRDRRGRPPPHRRRGPCRNLGCGSSIARTLPAGRTRWSRSSTSSNSWFFSCCRRWWPCWLFWIPPESLMPWRVLASPVSVAPAAIALSFYLALCWLAAAIVVAAFVLRAARYDVSTVLRFHRSRNLATRNVLHSPDHPHCPRPPAGQREPRRWT